MDFQTVDKYTSNALAIQEAGRMRESRTTFPSLANPC